MIQKHKHEIIVALFISVFVFAFYHLYGIILPFLLGLLLAFSVFPFIVKLQKVFKNKTLAISVFLAGITGIIIILFILLAQYINKDFNRLNNSFTTLVLENKSQLGKIEQKAKEYIGKIYDFEEFDNYMSLQPDSIQNIIQKTGTFEIDTDAIKASFDKIISAFQPDEESDTEEKTGFSFIFILISTILYFILILFNIDYFNSIQSKFFSSNIKSKINTFYRDFDQSFVMYFKLRTKIVLILSVIYLIGFIFLDMPGTILFILIIFLLSYIPYLQYLALIPLSITCLVLSIESNQSFLFFFGIVVGVFILSSLIEEIVLNPWIMEKNIGMNPVIMILGISIWGYLLGITGILIGIPLTSLLIIYFKRYILSSYTIVNQDN